MDLISKLAILAELTSTQKKKIRGWAKKSYPYNVEHTNHVFGKKTRLTEPSLDKGEATPHPDVKAFLSDKKYKLKDYKAGLAHPEDNPKREMKIGKILEKEKAPDTIKKTYMNDPARAGSKSENLLVTHSRHPYDVAGMSTGKGWVSCMSMDKKGPHQGAMNHTLPHDVAHGTHVSYLHKESDPTISNPLARIALKPHTHMKSGHTVLIPEDQTYGTATPGFRKQVKDWTDKHFPMKPNEVYSKHDKLYDDSDSPHKIHLTDVNEAIRNTGKDKRPLLSALEKKSFHDNEDLPNQIDHTKIKGHMDGLVDNSLGRDIVAKHATPETIHHLAMNDNAKHAATAARSHNLTAKDAHVLADHHDRGVRNVLLSNPNLPDSVIKHMARNDSDPDIKRLARKQYPMWDYEG